MLQFLLLVTLDFIEDRKFSRTKLHIILPEFSPNYRQIHSFKTLFQPTPQFLFFPSKTFFSSNSFSYRPVSFKIVNKQKSTKKSGKCKKLKKLVKMSLVTLRTSVISQKNLLTPIYVSFPQSKIKIKPLTK